MCHKIAKRGKEGVGWPGQPLNHRMRACLLLINKGRDVACYVSTSMCVRVEIGRGTTCRTDTFVYVGMGDNREVEIIYGR